jgi:hypothetical protein
MSPPQLILVKPAFAAQYYKRKAFLTSLGTR